jgi:hypothetical protein
VHEISRPSRHASGYSPRTQAPNVNNLHWQNVKGRDIDVTEDPRLHFVWIKDRISLTFTIVPPLALVLEQTKYLTRFLYQRMRPMASVVRWRSEYLRSFSFKGAFRHAGMHFTEETGSTNFHRICSWLTQEFCDRSGSRRRGGIWNVRGGGIEALQAVNEGEVQLSIATPAEMMRGA